MPNDTILYEVAGGVATITLNRPDKRNAIDAAMFRALGDAASEAAGDDTVRAVLLRGEGPSFCAGIDLSSFPDLFGKPAEQLREFIAMAQRPFAVLASMRKPTIAAVQGHALGAGCQLAIACDLRLAAEDVQLGILELNFGIIPDLGGNSRLTGLVGPARAKELIWTGRRVDAAEAERIGMVNRVVAPGELDAEARALAAAVAARAPLPVRHVKSLVDRASREPLDALMSSEMDAQTECLSSEDHREAVAAYLEKREPRFTGR